MVLGTLADRNASALDDHGAHCKNKPKFGKIRGEVR
jgi:hypothetical protein